MSDKIQQQIEALEIKVAFQEETIEQLNQVVTNQDAIIRKLEQRFSVVSEKILDMESQLPDKSSSPTDEVPPHY